MKAKTIIASLFLLAVSVACKEAQLGTYSGENYVHFFPDGNDAVKADYNFAEMGTTREETAEIPLNVRLPDLQIMKIRMPRYSERERRSLNICSKFTADRNCFQRIMSSSSNWFQHRATWWHHPPILPPQ